MAMNPRDPFFGVKRSYNKFASPDIPEPKVARLPDQDSPEQQRYIKRMKVREDSKTGRKSTLLATADKERSTTGGA